MTNPWHPCLRWHTKSIDDTQKNLKRQLYFILMLNI